MPARTPTRGHVIALANHKGGCAKTTSVANLAAALAERRRRTLVIDADPQANLSDAFGIRPDDDVPRLEHALAEPGPGSTPPTWPSRPGNVDVVPCSADLAHEAAAHAQDPTFAYALQRLVDRERLNYDAILIDTPPGIGPLSSMAMLAADWVIVPARPADFDVAGAISIADLIDNELLDANPTLKLLGVLITQADGRWTITADTRAALARANVKRLRTEIPARVRVGAAPRHGAPTFVLEPDGMFAQAYRTLAAELDEAVLSR